MVEVGWLSLVGSPSPGGQAELAVRKAPMEADILVSYSSALLPTPIPSESIFQLLNTKEPTISLVYMVRTPKGGHLPLPGP